MKSSILFSVSIATIIVLPATLAHAEDAPAKIQVGDQWTYLEQNNITGAVNGKLVMTVTEATDKNFTLNISTPANNHSYLIVFDQNWNSEMQDQVKFAPNDGRGLPHDAKVGSSWKTAYTWRDVGKGVGGKGEAVGKCVANESVTVDSGTFDNALKCDVVIKTKPPGGGPAVSETEMITWFAPTTLRWAKRQFITKKNGHVSEDRTQELVDFNLK